VKYLIIQIFGNRFKETNYLTARLFQINRTRRTTAQLPVRAIIDGKEHYDRITQNDAKYGIGEGGAVIAEVAHRDGWQQLTGSPLSKALLESICEHIASH
jgi:hypothetical protein